MSSVDSASTILDAPCASVAAFETPTATAFSATFVVKPGRRTSRTTTASADGRKFVGDIAQHGLVTCKQLVDIRVVRHRLLETAGSEQAQNLRTISAPPASNQSFSGRWCGVHGGQTADDERVV